MKNPRHIYRMLWIVILFTFHSPASAQWKVSGRVADTSGEPLPGVVVTMSDAADKILAFCSTDGKGNFTLSLPGKPSADSRVSFSLLGFSTMIFTPGQMREGMKVTLSESPLELREVIVKISPIKSKGDTLTYDVASFRSKADRNIEDVIKKLPGVEVSENGGISYNGERINRFYIEGLDVVGGRYAIATRNISPDDILSVEVFENHQPKQVLKNIDITNKAALNLRMKRKSMLKPVGNVKGGAGADDNGDAKWLGEAFGMLIAPATQVLVTAKTNNWGSSYADETKSLIAESEEKTSIASKIYGSTPFGEAKIPSERYFDNRSASVSVNTISKTGQYGKLNFTADYTDEDNRTVNTESITYSNGDNPVIGFYERIESNPHAREAKFSVKFENNAPTAFISDKFSFRGRFADNNYSIVNSGDVLQDSRTDDYNFSNSLDVTIRKGKRIVSFHSDMAVVTTPVCRIGAVDGGSTILAQRGSALSFTTSEKIGHSWILGNNSTLGVNLRFESAYDKFKSGFTAANSASDNNVDGYDLQAIVEPEYRYRPGTRFNLKVTLPVTMTAMRFSDRLTDRRYPIEKTDFGVRTVLNFKPTARLSSTLTLGRTVRLGGIKDYITNPIYVTYRQQTTFGSGMLNSTESYSAMANIFFRDPITAFFVTFTGLYRFGHSNRISGSDVTADNVISSVENRRNSSDMLNANLSVSKNMRPWRTTFTIDGNINSLRRKVLRQQKPYSVGNLIYKIHGAVTSTPFNGAIDLSVNAWYTRSIQKIAAIGLRNNVNDIVAQASLSVHPSKNLEIYSSGYWNHVVVVNDTSKESFFIGGGVKYHTGHFDFELSGKNLTNCRSYSYSYFSESDIYSYTFSLRPIEFLASVKYTF